jgi:hypothetical protein
VTIGDRTENVPATGRVGPVLTELIDAVAKHEVSSPQTHAHFLQEDITIRRHQHRLAWANWALRFAGLILGASTVAGMTLLSWHAMDIGEPQQVKYIIGIPTIGLAALFVTGKAINISIGQRESSIGPAMPDPAPSPNGTVKSKKARRAAV